MLQVRFLPPAAKLIKKLKDKKLKILKRKYRRENMVSPLRLGTQWGTFFMQIYILVKEI